MHAAEKITIFFKGAAMGCADIIPGVSGGTIALILGIYSRLIGAIKSFNIALLGHLKRLDIKAAWNHTDAGFVLLLAGGLVAGVLFCVKILQLPTLLETHTEPLYGLFFGLILGSSILLIAQRLPLGLKDIMLIFLGALFTLGILQLTPAQPESSSLLLFLSGAMAISAMLLPGISGSFLLLIAGQYATILEAVGNADMGVLLPFFAGVFCGLIAMSRIIYWLLQHYARPTLCVMIGILLGSLWRIWPYQMINAEGISQPSLEMHVFLPETFATTLAGLLVTFMIYRKSKRVGD